MRIEIYTDRMDKSLPEVKITEVRPKFIPIKCVVCSGFGTVSMKAIKCHACQGKGYILVETEEVRNG